MVTGVAVSLSIETGEGVGSSMLLVVEEVMVAVSVGEGVVSSVLMGRHCTLSAGGQQR